MSESTHGHIWTVGAVRSRIEAPATDFDYHQTTVKVRCHRRRRGPYTGGGAILRLVVPELLSHDPNPLARHLTEIGAIAPDLADRVGRSPRTLTETASAVERTRFYPADRTARLAHGIAELLLDWARICHGGGVRLVLQELVDADQTDQELAAILLRRCDPTALQIVVQSTTGTHEPALASALSTYAQRIDVNRDEIVCDDADDDTDEGDLAQMFIDTAGLTDSSRAQRAYSQLDDFDRRRRHTARADRIKACVEPGAELGELCYQMERGVEPAAEVHRAVHDAVLSCFRSGFYHAALELSERGYRSAMKHDDDRSVVFFAQKIAACKAYLGGGHESMAYLDQVRRLTTDPDVHMNAAYFVAMLYTRLLPKADHDEQIARAWINTAIAFAGILTEPVNRVFSTAFMLNGRALVDLHCGDLEGALRQVDRAIAETDAVLEPEQHQLHRSVLRYNRAQVLGAMGRSREAVIEYDDAIRRDPEYGDYYFERAALQRAAGNITAALSDYAIAVGLTPPFFEAHYNRADLLREVGRDGEALADLDRALELEPTHIESLTARADLLLELGRPDAAAADIENGLRHAPDNPHLLSLQAALVGQGGDSATARDLYSRALDLDPGLVGALVNRAVLAYNLGDPAAAVADLDRALDITESGVIRFNHAVALQELGEHDRALADLGCVSVTDDIDPLDVLFRRGLSRIAVGDLDGGRADWAEHLAGYDSGTPSPYADHISLCPEMVRAKKATVGAST